MEGVTKSRGDAVPAYLIWEVIVIENNSNDITSRTVEEFRQKSQFGSSTGGLRFAKRSSPPRLRCFRGESSRLVPLPVVRGQYLSVGFAWEASWNSK
jgi:hypothetical protein